MGYNVWQIIENTNDAIIRIYNFLVSIIVRLRYNKHLKGNCSLVNQLNSEEIVLLMNGPSIEKEVHKIPKNIPIVAVNKGIYFLERHKIKPDYVVIIDDKLWTTDWGGENLIKQYLKVNKELILVLNVKWSSNKILQDYKDRIIWIAPLLQISSNIGGFNISKAFQCQGVFGASLNFVIHLGYKKIKFLGNDGDGLPREILGISTHSYGVNSENKTTLNFISDLKMMSRGLRYLHLLSKKTKEKNIEVINLSEFGILDMFIRS